MANKPLFVSSNKFLNNLKKRDNVKKGGFSGILDPFACGALIVAYGQYTRLFSFINKEPKVYKATLWLGLKSDSLDIENIMGIYDTPKLSEARVQEVVESFCGEVKFTPPKFSAKKIEGKKAYELARAGEEVILKEEVMKIFKIEFLGYNHPFVSFRVWVSAGSYIRSLGEMIAQKLGTFGALSYLERESEGGFKYEGQKHLNPLEILPFCKINARDLENGELYSKMINGKKLEAKELKIYKEGEYIVYFDEFFSIISYKNHAITYLLNRIPLC